MSLPDHTTPDELATDKESKMPKMRHCFYCGKELGCYPGYDPLDTCGQPECNRAAQDAVRAEREEAHERLDRDMGWERW